MAHQRYRAICSVSFHGGLMDEIPMFPNVDVMYATVLSGYQHVFYPIVLRYQYAGWEYIRGELMSMN